MVILRCGTEYLLLRRAKMPNAGKYVPVGGKLEHGERPVEAAIRETKEETGIEIPPPRLCGILSESSPVNYNWLCYIYLADIPYQTPPYCNEGQLEWISSTQLRTIPTPPTDLAIYDFVDRGEMFVMDAVYDEALNLLQLVNELSGADLRHFIPAP
ncbi:MAG: NUDIX domain-containing protein [Bacteroidetes bacterium]|nr:MAG: NUDIX domain-containing protein [Bacteroidota bacterium]